MSIKKRLSANLRVVSLTDTAIFDLPVEALKKYALSRDLDDLPLDKCTERPTIWTLRPLLSRWEHLAQVPDSASLWLLFATHCVAVEGLDFELPRVESNGETRLADAARDLLPPDVVCELAAVIVEAASRADGRPFSPPGSSWEQQLIRYRSLRVLRGADQTATAQTPITPTA